MAGVAPVQAPRATPLLTVDSAERTGADKLLIANAVLEDPATGSQRRRYALDFTGWAIGLPAPLARAQLLHDDVVLAELPATLRRPDVAANHPDLRWAADSGFHGTISALRLHPEFEVIVNVVLEDGSRSGFATVKGRREPLRRVYEAQLQPLMITTLGRTGSTWLMHLLGCHPELLAYQPFEIEARAATYWLDLMVALSEPAASFNQLDSHVDFSREWWLGSDHRVGPNLTEPELRTWMMREHVEELAVMAQERIDAVYRRVASTMPGSRGRYFVEKFLPENTVPQLTRELYPESREIFLVRDFRDMVCSMRAYDAKRGVAGFGRDRAASEDAYIRKLLGGAVNMLLTSWCRRRDDALLVRYEDLIAEPERTLRRMFEYVGVEASRDVVQAVRDRAARHMPRMSDHQTAGRPEQSIGRWRRDLEPEWQQVCLEAFGPALREFGYTDAG